MAYLEETTFGTVPSGTPTIANIRYTGETLQQATSSANSEEIDANRNVKGVFRSSFRANGDINFEASYASHDDFYEAGLMSAAWTSEVIVEATENITVAASGNTVTVAGTFDNTPAVGSWVRLEGFTTNGADIICKVSESVTPSTTVFTAEGFTFVDEGPTAVTITQLSEIKTGTTFRSFTIEREHTDLTNIFAQFSGMMVNTTALSVTTDGVITGTFGMLGQKQISPSPSATFGDGTNTAVNSNEVFNAVDHVELILEGGASFDITSFDLSVNSNLRERLKVGFGGVFEIGSGVQEVSGGARAYFADNSQVDKYLAFTTTSFAIAIKDTAGNRFIIDVPNVKLTAAPSPSSGQNEDVLVDLTFSAFETADEVGNFTIRMVRDAA
jgi:hypothetical protein